ncbi:MAG: hypothetical protein KC547_03890 [Anaerolineae bacterium]|nr:hypothetical protein [Anaerolineae bacterium]MCA9908892.1 hypothetical protein [Anaerolineae bacterium]
MSQLRSLANRLTLKARDQAAEAKRKAPGDPQAEYLRGLAEGYYKSAVELANILKGQAGDMAAETSVPDKRSTQTGKLAASGAPEFEQIPLDEVIRLLSYADINARDVIPNRDGSFVAIFSRWQPLSDQERLEKLKSVDTRIFVLANGRNHETSDPFIKFGFKRN